MKFFPPIILILFLIFPFTGSSQEIKNTAVIKSLEEAKNYSRTNADSSSYILDSLAASFDSFTDTLQVEYLLAKSVCYQGDIGNYDEALEALKIADDISKEMGGYKQGDLYMEWGGIYLFLEDFENARLKFAQAEGNLNHNPSLQIRARDQLGGCYYHEYIIHQDRTHLLDSALAIYNENINRAQTLNDTTILDIVYSNYAMILFEIEDFDKGMKYANKCIDMALARKDSMMLIVQYVNIGLVMYPDTVRADSLMAQAQELMEIAGKKAMQQRVYELLQNRNEYYGFYERAFNYQKKFYEMKEDIAADDLRAQLSEWEISKENALKDQQLAEEKNLNSLLWVGLIVFAVGAIIMIWLVVQLKSQKQQLQKLDEFKSNFFTNISHEFRTPLSLILGLANRLKENSKVQSDAEVIERNGSHLLKLVNEILQLSKIESGEQKVKRQNVDLVSFAKFYVNSFQSLAQQKGLHLEVKTSHEEAVILADANGLSHVLINLIGNALKYTPSGSVVVEVLKENQGYSLQVHDSGMGIAEKELPLIFNRFYQSQNTLTEGGGTGIGLALSKELVQLMNGSISVTSELDVGSTFTVNWPLGKSEEIIKTPVSLDYSLSIPTSFSGNDIQQIGEKPLVLLVEDNADLSQYITSELSDEFAVIQAENGEVGLKMAEDQVPDFIISDWMMPKMEGDEMVRKIKENPITSHIPCMLLTAKSDEKSRLEGLEIGVEAFLSKPFNSGELILQIRNLIQSRNRLRNKLMDESKEESSLPIENEFLSKTRQVIEKLILEEQTISGEILGEKMNYSRSQFSRKLKALTGLSISQFVNQLRLERAAYLILHSDKKLSEIAYELGFSDPAYFSRLFSKQYQASPKLYKEKEGKV